MSNQSFKQTRRNFLKGAAYTSALAVVGAAGSSSLAVAGANTITRQQTTGTEAIDLINHTASPVSLDSQGLLSIAPGEQRSFVVAKLGGNNGSANNKNLFITDVLANDRLAIKSNYPEFNGIVPATEFAMQAA